MGTVVHMVVVGLQVGAAVLGAALAYRSISRARTRRPDGTTGGYGALPISFPTLGGALVGLLSLGLLASVLVAAVAGL